MGEGTGSRGRTGLIGLRSMSLRFQVITGVAVVGLVTLLSLYGIVLPRVAHTFERIERSDVQANVNRAQNAVASELANLETTAHDWAAWDESAEFVQGLRPGFAENNLMEDTFANLRLNLMVFLDSTERAVYGETYGLESSDAPSSADLLAAATRLSALRTSAQDTESHSGIIALDGHLALVAIHPILMSQHEPPALGTLVIGRVVDAQEVARIGSQIELPLGVRTIGDARNSPEVLARLAAPGASAVVMPLSASVVAGYSEWRDLWGQPVAVLAVEMPRDMYRTGVATNRYLMMGIMSLFLVLAVGFLYFLNARVLARTSRLTRDAARIARTSDASQRVSVTGRDELSTLGSSINGMLASIEESRAALSENERRYRSLFETSRDPIYITAEDGRFIDVNRAFLELFQFTKNEIMTMTAGDLYVRPEDRDAFRAAIREKGFVTSYPVTLRRKDGTRVHCLLTTILDVRSADPGPVYQGIIRDVTELLRQQEELTYLATHDPLTGLLTRGALDDVLQLEISRAMRNLERLAVFYLDLDRFKEVNDAHGHAAGDRLLKEVADRLRGSLRASDTLARLGGDEFVALLAGIESPHDAEVAADKIVRTLRKAFRVNDRSHDLSVSIGIALYPDDGESGAHLIRKADAAMYSVKAHGRDGWRRFEGRLDVPSRS